MRNLIVAIALGLALAAPAAARQLTIDDVASLSRVSAPAASADGQWLVWQQRETDLSIDGARFDLWRLDLTKKGAVPEHLVADGEANETAPQFSRDGKTVYFQSDKGGSDAVWAVDISGANARRLTDFKGGMGGFIVAPTDDRIAIFADRLPGAPSLEVPMAKKDPLAGNGRTYDQLFVRHWASWADGTRSQLFVVPLGVDGAKGNGVAIEHGLIGDTPSKPFGGTEEVSWSADGKTLFFALREAGRIEPLSTNLDIFAAPADGSAPPQNLTAANKATDTLPTVSPDGKTLAYVAMARAGYEADRQVLMLRDLASGKTLALTQEWDRSIGSISWARDGKSLLVTAEDTQENPVWSVNAASGKVVRLTRAGNVTAVVPTRGGIIYAMNSLVAPDDFYLLPGTGTPVRLTAVNAAKLEGIDMPGISRFTFKGAHGDAVWGYAV
ncbi:MAG: S9 family peptidase, partial [Sphingomonas sp.]